MWPHFTSQQLETALGIVMRVPGLFIIDYWWQHDRTKLLPHSANSHDIINAIVTNLVLLHGFLLLLLPMQRVQALYTHFVSAILLLSGHMISRYYVRMEFEIQPSTDHLFISRQSLMLVLQSALAILASYLLVGPGKPSMLMLGAYVLPVFVRMANMPMDMLEVAHYFSSGLVGLSMLRYAYFQLPDVLDCLKDVIADVVLVTEVSGWISLGVALWNKLFVPNHFLLFWLSKFFVRLCTNFLHPHKVPLWGDEWYILVLSSVSSICDSPVSLVSTAVTVSYLSYGVLRSTKSFLMGQFALLHDNPMYSGWTEGLTLVLFALQTGLIEMKMPARMAVMTIILFIDLSTLFQSMLEITEPVVLSLSASRSNSTSRQVRAFTVCAFLFAFPLYLTYSLAQVFPLDFWMVVLLSSCVLTSVQVLDLLVIHSLFVYDSSRSEPWESLDDIVYYTRAVTKVLEFLVAVFVVAVGLWESPTGEWNWANSSIIIIHCYFNVWQRLQAGWKSFVLRWEAVKKIESLPSASEAQLAVKDDICAICFSEMDSACVTPCVHLFHRTCLRKWLYVQDTCPMCHAPITVVKNGNTAPTQPTSQEAEDLNEEEL